MAVYFMRQCRLEMPTDKGIRVQTSWIPEDKAKLGNYVDLEPRGEDRTGPWRVAHVGGRKSFKEVQDRSQDFKRTRKASDIRRDGKRRNIFC